MSGYNKNNIKMNVLGTSTARQSDIVQVELPSNSIVDLSSLAWAFDLAFAAPGAGGAAHYPINAESIINRLAVEVNGTTLVNITNYNVLYHTLLYMTATEDYQRQRLVAQAIIRRRLPPPLGAGSSRPSGVRGDTRFVYLPIAVSTLCSIVSAMMRRSCIGTACSLSQDTKKVRSS